MAIIFSSAFKNLFKKNKKEDQFPEPSVQKTRGGADNRSVEEQQRATEDVHKIKPPKEG